jgi:ketosteroid isomerase-like protein
MSPLREQLLKITQDWLSSFNSNTPEGVIAHRSADCEHHVLPTSLNDPVRSNEEFQAFILPVLHLMKLEIKLAEGAEPIIDEEARKIVLFVRSEADTVVGPYKNEYVFVLHTNDAGTEITRVVEFLDTAVSAEFRNKVMAYVAQLSDQQK